MSLADLVRTDAPLRYGASAVYPHKFALERRYRFTSRFGDEVLLHRREGHELHLPRALCPVGPHDERTKGEVAHFPTCPTPRPNQVKLFDEALDCLCTGLSGLFRAYTGWGKTVLGYRLAFEAQRKTLVVTSKEDIFKQWVDGACGLNGSPNFLGLTPDEVGVVRGDKVQIWGRKFVVAMIHTLAKPGRVPPELAAQFGLVIYDECHRLPAETFQATADLFPAFWRYGLSAHEERADGKELLLYAHIGPVRAETDAQLMVPKVLVFQSGWTCPRRIVVTTAGKKEVRLIPHEPGKTTHVEKILAVDDDRNRKLGELILTAHGRGRRTVVFSTLHDHLRAMHKAAHALGVPNKDMGFYVGAQTKADREERERVKARPVIFTTFAMMGEGTNIPWLDCGILAMPRSQVEQPCGRIRREHPDKPDPVWMDLVDADSPVFGNYARTRRSWYAEIGAAVKAID